MAWGGRVPLGRIPKPPSEVPAIQGSGFIFHGTFPFPRMQSNYFLFTTPFTDLSTSWCCNRILLAFLIQDIKTRRGNCISSNNTLNIILSELLVLKHKITGRRISFIHNSTVRFYNLEQWLLLWRPHIDKFFFFFLLLLLLLLFCPSYTIYCSLRD